MRFQRPLNRVLHATRPRTTFDYSPQRIHISIRLSSSCASADMANIDTSQRLSKLRQLMKEKNVDVYSMVVSEVAVARS
jgi:hypothetical protein